MFSAATEATIEFWTCVRIRLARKSSPAWGEDLDVSDTLRAADVPQSTAAPPASASGLRLIRTGFRATSRAHAERRSKEIPARVERGSFADPLAFDHLFLLRIDLALPPMCPKSSSTATMIRTIHTPLTFPPF